MKTFDPIIFDAGACRQELDELKDLLDERHRLSERDDIGPFFRSRPHLSAFIGSYFAYMSNFDRIAYEYDVFGDFKADVVIGDSQSGWFAFVEFEDASSSSLFKKRRNKASPEWSYRFERGFSQVIDWFWKLSDMSSTREFSSRFGNDYSGYEGMLVIGRSDDLEQRERDRLRWRRQRVLVNSKRVHCVTFDELYTDLDSRLSTYEAAYQADDDA